MTWRSRIRIGFAAAIVAVLAFELAPSADAHAELTSISPDDGATVPAPLSAVTLTFSEDLIEAAAKVVVNDSAGNVVARDRSRVNGSTISLFLPGDLSPGAYMIGYRVVSSDGHPITGKSSFTLTGMTASPTPDESPSLSPSLEASVTSPTASTSVITGAASHAVAGSPQDEHSSTWVIPLIAAVLLTTVAAIAVIRWLVLR